MRSSGRAWAWARLIGVVAVGWLTVWGFAHVFDVAVTERAWQVGVPALAAWMTCVVGAAIVWVGRRRPQAAADLTVAATAVIASGLATLGLHGTRWGMTALYADAAFRTEAVTRFAATPRLVDHAYQGLPAHYPPALPWVQGRLAALFDVAGWEVMKPTELVLYAAIPLLAYLLWRRVLTPLPAASVVLASTLATLDLQKPDEAMVLACLLPWWIELVRGARNPRSGAWPFWVHGLVLGLMLLTHTYYFLPLFVATVLGLGVDLARRRPLRPPIGRGLAVAAVGLLVSAVYWGPLALERLQAAHWENLQLRYSYPFANVPALPVPDGPVGIVGAAGLIWLVRAQWPSRTKDHDTAVAGALALALVGSYLTLGAGAIAQQMDVGLLTFKTNHLVVAVQVTAGVLGLHAAVTASVHRLGQPEGRVRTTAALVAVLVLAAPGAAAFAEEWAVGEPSLAAQTTRYPSGAWPDGRHGMEPHPSPRNVEAGDPSVREVLRTYERLSGEPADADTVLVTSKVDLLATHPVHSFITWKSIYSNPLGQFMQRHRFLSDVGSSSDPGAAAARLRTNPYDRVDGLVLQRRGDQYVLPLTLDDFPNRTQPFNVTFDPRLFAGPAFEVRELGRIVVIVVDPDRGG